jgi:alginate O-acetyltransferase complex protein AlgI
MVFNSIDFLLFFPLLYLLYCILKKRGQNLLLLVGSYFFYGYWDYRYLSLLLLSTVIDYIASLGIEKNRDNTHKKKLYLALSILSNLTILGFFKYYNFFTLSAKVALQSIGFTTSPILLEFALPLGISFYTFQTMSYTIDVYRGHLKPTRNILDFALFVSYFPQLVAGPIERATSLLPQILNERVITYDQIEKGIFLILFGFFKKVYVADNISIIIDPIFADSGASGSMVLFACIAHTFQIYGDFAGYSDIARGLSKVMGIELMRNFNHPLLSRNLGEFWRRWHISFMSWLRDYVYFSLGDKTSSELRKNLNNLFVFFLSGLWHGANWTFVVWGSISGVVNLTYKYLNPYLPGISEDRNKVTNFIIHVSGIIITFLAVTLPLIFFRSQSIEMSFTQINSLFTNFGSLELKLISKLFKIVALLMIVEIYQYIKEDEFSIFQLPIYVRTGLYISLFYSTIILGNFNQNAFIYFVF